MADVPKLREAYEQDERVREMLDLGQRLEGLTRHASTHAAGVVIAPRPIVEFAPLYRGTKETDEITTQFAKDEIEEIGLLKMDFLGLKTLTLIDDAVRSIAEETGEQRSVSGLFAAVSFDEARTWPLRKLISDYGPSRRVDGGGNTGRFTMSARSGEPRGYLSVCQTPDGVVQLITSKQHYAFNLAWLKAPMPAPPAPVRSGRGRSGS